LRSAEMNLFPLVPHLN